MINVEQMRNIRAASAAGKNAKEAAAAFLQAPYYRSWSRAQLNNTEYAPMLALLCFVLKYNADKEKRQLTTLEKVGCWSSVFFSWMFIFGKINAAPMRPPSPRGGAVGRYASMALLLWLVVRGPQANKIADRTQR